MTEFAMPPGVTVDPKDQAELEALFGVTSNAEELIRQNRSRYTPTQLKVYRLKVNGDLTASLHLPPREGAAPGEVGALNSDMLEDAIGHPVVSAVVRGSGRNAHVSYTYMGSRNSLEKDVIPYASVVKTPGAKPAAAPVPDPTEAADKVLADAEAKANDAIAAAHEKAQQIIEDARAEIAKLQAEAEADAKKVREQAAKDAPVAAQEAADAEAKAKAHAATTGQSTHKPAAGKPAGR